MSGMKSLTVLVVVVAILVYIYKTFIQKPLPVLFDGRFHPDFQEVADIYKENLRNGDEVGSSFAAYYEGEPLVDIWGGYADVDTRRPWTKDTLSIIFSATKGVTAILAALFVDRGWLDYSKPVAHYWPKFGQNGKDNITVALLLSHQGGLSITNGTIPMEWIDEKPEKVWEFLEKQKPYWPPGTGYSYHGITFGLFVDSLLTKADPKHRRVDKIFKEEIGDKFGIELYNGIPNSLFHRVARHESHPLHVSLWKMISNLDTDALTMMYALASGNSVLTKMAASGTDKLPSDLSLNTPEYNKIPQSSYNGHSNARNLAKLYGIIANGGKTKAGVLLTEKTIELLKQPLTSGTSVDGVININFGYGVGVKKDEKGNAVFGHDGAGGQSAFADTARKSGFGYVTARLKNMSVKRDKQFQQYLAAYYRCLEKYLQRRQKT